MQKMKIISIPVIVIVLLSVLSVLPSCKDVAEPKTIVETVAGETVVVEETVIVEVEKEDKGVIKFWADKPWDWQTMYDAFTAKTGIRVEETLIIGTEFEGAVKAAVVTQKGPDVFTWWTGSHTLDLASKGLLEPVDDLWAEVSDAYSQGIIDTFKYEGTTYGTHLFLSTWQVTYNTEVFNKLGLKEPQTWDDFIAICDTMLENGITPIAHFIEPEWGSWFWPQALFAANYREAYDKVLIGEETWLCEEAQDVFKTWQDMFAKGYFAKPGLQLSEDIPRVFASGDVGMYYGGTWIEAVFKNAEVPPELYSNFILPAWTGPQRQMVVETGPLCISANAQNTDAAKEFCRFWLSEEGQQLWQDAQGFLSPRVGIDVSALSPYVQKIKEDVFEDPTVIALVKYGDGTLSNIMWESHPILSKFILNPTNYMRTLEEMDKLFMTEWEKFRKEN